MLDGKVSNYLTRTSSINCPVCRSGTDEFKSLANYGTEVFRPKNDACAFGIQPLHAWMRFLQHVLNLAYNLPVREQRASQNAAAALRAAKKQEIQDAYKQFGILIDRPAPNGRGNTLNGNMARKVFMNPDRLAQITGVNRVLIRRYW